MSFFNDPKYSDLEIRCEDKRYHVHKVILCSQSPVFDRMLSVEMKEKISGVLEIEEECPSIVEGFLKYLYGHTKSLVSDGSQDPRLGLYARVYAMADFYQTHFIKPLAVKFLRANIEESKAGYFFPGMFCDCVKVCYQSIRGSNQELKDVLIDGALKFMNNKARAQMLIKAYDKTPEFAIDMAKAQTRKMYLDVVEWECSERPCNPSGPLPGSVSGLQYNRDIRCRKCGRYKPEKR
ncbi:MAG: hypothetical protein M1828_001305 [Chrysothrix sp. TS-e1954]|nr:MAG: hypothetical protein M1828_001305 [Chrysothrix sp. TS-e1954]